MKYCAPFKTSILVSLLISIGYAGALSVWFNLPFFEPYSYSLENMQSDQSVGALLDSLILFLPAIVVAVYMVLGAVRIISEVFGFPR